MPSRGAGGPDHGADEQRRADEQHEQFPAAFGRLLGGGDRRLAAAVHGHRIGAGFGVDQREDLVADFLGRSYGFDSFEAWLNR